MFQKSHCWGQYVLIYSQDIVRSTVSQWMEKKNKKLPWLSNCHGDGNLGTNVGSVHCKTCQAFQFFVVAISDWHSLPVAFLILSGMWCVRHKGYLSERNWLFFWSGRAAVGVCRCGSVWVGVWGMGCGGVTVLICVTRWFCSFLCWGLSHLTQHSHIKWILVYKVQLGDVTDTVIWVSMKEHKKMHYVLWGENGTLQYICAEKDGDLTRYTPITSSIVMTIRSLVCSTLWDPWWNFSHVSPAITISLSLC